MKTGCLTFEEKTTSQHPPSYPQSAEPAFPGDEFKNPGLSCSTKMPRGKTGFLSI